MKLRYTKAERIRKSAVETVLSDPAATSSDRMAAVRSLERLENAARRRAEEREWNLPEPGPAPEPTVDDMVRQLEAQKQPPQPVENKGPENGPNAVNAARAPISAPTVPEVTPTAPEAVIADLAVIQDLADGKKPLAVPVPESPRCHICKALAPDPYMTWPMSDPNGKRLCPACYSKLCALTAHSGPPAPVRDVLAGRGETAGTFDLSSAHPNATRSDLEKSVRIWEQQAQDDADRAARDRQERDRAESEFHRNRADFLARGGRL